MITPSALLDRGKPLRALTIMQPSTLAILEGVKHWENRPGPAPSTIKLGEWIALHAGAKLWPQASMIRQLWPEYPGDQDLIFGSVIGFWQYGGSFRKEDLVDPGPSALGPWCLKISGVLKLPDPVSCPGRQGWWFLSDTVSEKVRAQLWEGVA